MIRNILSFLALMTRKNITLRSIVWNFCLRELMWFKGINVVLTHKCNLNCDYCYEKDVQSRDREISIDNFNKIITWLKKNNKKKIILLGGEPTQHGEFKEILNICKKNSMDIRILTNMMFDDSVLRLINEYNGCVLQANINHPSTYKDNMYNIVYYNIKKMYKRVGIILRYNIYSGNEDYRPIINLAKETNSHIRFSLINSPLKCEISLKQRQAYLRQMHSKDKISNFIDACDKVGVFAFFARPVPKCIFSKDELRRYKKNGIKFKCYVGRDGDYAARLNVNPDLTIRACYGVPICGPAIDSFKDYKELSQYYKDDFIQLRRIPAVPECISCKEFIADVCQGGCLSEKANWNI